MTTQNNLVLKLFFEIFWDIPNLISAYMVYAGFRDARRDILDPPAAQSARASPDPHDEELIDARQDQEEMEESSGNHQQVPTANGETRKEGLQGPGQRRRVVSVAQASTRVCSPHFRGRRDRGWFSSWWMKIRPICSLHLSFACTDMLRTTG